MSPLFRSAPRLRLDSTPTGEEEFADWNDERRLSGEWDPNAARTRIEKISRTLVVSWSLFLAYIILAQGFRKGFLVLWLIPVAPAFHLESSEFIAVVTTTTLSVFGFLIIVSRHLFSAKESDGDFPPAEV